MERAIPLHFVYQDAPYLTDIPCVRDRVVQQAMRQVIEPIFEPKFLNCSCGFRPDRSALDAINRISNYLEEGYVWVVDTDLKFYFDSIPHEKLIDKVAKEISDGSVLKLIRSFLKAGVVADGIWTESEVSSPQGGVISRCWPISTCIPLTN